MYINKINTSLGVMLLGMFALSSALYADAQPIPLSPFCVGAETVDNLAPLCMKMVGGAATWEDAIRYCVNRIARRVKRAEGPLATTIEAKLSPSMSTSTRTQILGICKDGLADALRLLEDCKDVIVNPPFVDLASKLTSVYTTFEDCRDAIVEERGQPDIVDVTKFNERIDRLIDVALVVAQHDPRKKEYEEKLARGEFKDSQGDPNLIGPINPSPFGAKN